MSAYFTFSKLTSPSAKDLGTSFERMAEILHQSGDTGKLQFEIHAADKVQHWLVDVNPKSSTAKPVKNEKADFEIITDADTWMDLANGKLSPLRAFLEHKIRLRGNLALGKKLLMNLSSTN